MPFALCCCFVFVFVFDFLFLSFFCFPPFFLSFFWGGGRGGGGEGRRGRRGRGEGFPSLAAWSSRPKHWGLDQVLGPGWQDSDKAGAPRRARKAPGLSRGGGGSFPRRWLRLTQTLDWRIQRGVGVSKPGGFKAQHESGIGSVWVETMPPFWVPAKTPAWVCLRIYSSLPGFKREQGQWGRVKSDPGGLPVPLESVAVLEARDF